MTAPPTPSPTPSPTPTPTPARRRWLVPTVTLALLVLGTAAVTIAVTLALSSDEDGTSGEEQERPAPSDVPTLGLPVPSAGEPDAAAEAPSGAVSELADAGWVARNAGATGIPARALAAYAGASIAISTSQPTCGLGWNTLAAIGLVESEHGAVDGATLDDSGLVSPPVIGVALDGDGVAEIPDTDAGELDGDTRWDHAVGPLQFIPATWTAYGTDGDGDGVADVHQIDDAALSAATYLCESGRDLTDPGQWIAAVSAYNRGTEYNQEIAAAASRYADAAGP